MSIKYDNRISVRDAKKSIGGFWEIWVNADVGYKVFNSYRELCNYVREWNK